MNPPAPGAHGTANAPSRRPSASWPPVLELEEMVGMGYFPEELVTPPPRPPAEPAATGSMRSERELAQDPAGRARGMSRLDLLPR